MGWYRQGTVAVTNGSGAVVGTATAWAAGIKTGDTFTVDGTTIHEVTAIADDTHLTISPVWGGTTGSGLSYGIAPTSTDWGQVSALSAQVATYLNAVPMILNGSGPPASGLGANNAIYFDLPNDNIYAKSAGAWGSPWSYAGSFSFEINGSAGISVAVTGNNPVDNNDVVTITLDGDVAAIAALMGGGLAVRTADNTWALRSVGETSDGLSVTNGDGVEGNIIIGLAGDLAAVEGLDDIGLAVRSAANTWATRTLTGTADEIAVANGTGAGGDPTFSLPALISIVGKTLRVGDANFEIRDTLDTTKILKIQAGDIATGTTRTLTAPNADGTIALAGSTQPLSPILTAVAAMAGNDGDYVRFLGGTLQLVQEFPITDIELRVLTSSGTYTPTDGMRLCLAIAIGGGAGGGGCAVGVAADMALAGGGGSAGAMAWAILTDAQIGVGVPVTVGAAGSGGAGNNAGTAGGWSGLGVAGALLKAGGGNPGQPAYGNTAGGYFGAGGAPATADTGGLRVQGAGGDDGFAWFATTLYGALSGSGGGSFLAGGGRALAKKSGDAGSNGATPTGYGAGGSGAVLCTNTNGATQTGGAGAQGAVIILEFIAPDYTTP